MPFVVRTRFTKTHAYITCQSATRDALDFDGNIWPVERRLFKQELAQEPEMRRWAVIDDCLESFQADLKRRGHPHGDFPLLYPEVVKYRVDNGGYIRKGWEYVGGNSRYYISVDVGVQPGGNKHLKQFYYPPRECFGFRGITKQEAALQAIAKTEDAYICGWPTRDDL